MGKSDVNVMTGTKVPTLRFKGYNDEWVEKKLGEFSTISNGSGDVQDANLTSGLYPFFDRSTVIKYVDEYNYDTHGIIYPGEGSKFYPKIYKGKFGLHQRAYVIYDLDETITNIDFIYQSMSLMNNYFLRMSVGSTVPSLRRDIFEKAKVELPELEEQVAIGQFFKTVDGIIQSEEQKLEQLKQIKKSFLQKMFPKKGATVPELRFDGFSGDWTEKKLGDVSTMHDSDRVPITASKRIAGKTPYYGANGIQDYVKGYTHDGVNILIAEDGASDIIDYPIQHTVGEIWVNNHAHVLKARPNVIDDYYLVNLLRNFNFYPYLVGGGRHKLNAGVMGKLPLTMALLPEQQQIGQFFKTFDELIAKQEEKVENGKLLKKALLQKMFV